MTSHYTSDTRRITAASSLIFTHEQLLLIILVVTALIYRLLFLVVFQEHLEFSGDPVSGNEMTCIGYNIASGHGFVFLDDQTPYLAGPTAWMPPLYPYLVAGIFTLFGSFTPESIQVIRLTQILVSSLTVIPIFYVAKRILGHQSAGVLSALIWVILPGAIKYSVNNLWSSSFEAFGIAVMILCFLRLSDEHVAQWEAVLLGLVIGLSTLTNPCALTIAPVASIWLLFYKRRKETFFHVTIAALVAVAVLLPWTIRNYSAFGSFVPVKGTFGLNLWLGNHGPSIDQKRAMPGASRKIVTMYPGEDGESILRLNDVEVSQELQRRALRYIRENPRVFLNYTARRIWIYWYSRPSVSLPGYNIKLIQFPAHVIFRTLSLLGLLLALLYHFRKSTLLAGAVIAFPLTYYISISHEYRFAFTIEPVMVILAAYPIIMVFDALIRMSQQRLKR